MPARQADRICGRLGTVIALFVAAPPAPAQDAFWLPSRDQPGQPAQPLRMVEPGTTDENPLSGPGRGIASDLRAPSGFDRVFELRGPGGRLETRSSRGGHAGSGVFLRISGGLVAVFPRSTYEEAEGVRFPTVPAGTYYSLGVPSVPSLAPGPREPTPPPGRAGALVSARAQRAVPMAGQTTDSASLSAHGAADERVPPDSMWANEAYRRRRIDELLDQVGGVPPASPAGWTR